MKKAFLILSFVFLVVLKADASSVSRTVLDNGLTVLIQEIPSSEVVSIYSCVKTGSALEERHLGKGISHFVEHMLFKGTSKRGVGAIAKEVKGLGGVINASTSHDYTMYTLDLPASAFKQGLDIAADMLLNSLFDKVEVEKERKVIHGEMGLYQDRPERVLSDLVFSNVYKFHPYRHPIIGYRAFFDSITPEELYAYYKERYIPSNIILSIAGPIRTQEVLHSVKQLFDTVKPSAYLERHLQPEPPQTVKRVLEKEYASALIHFSLAYQGVAVSDEDLFALDVLAMALGQGQDSRFFKDFYKEKRLVESISASNYTPFDRGLFEIMGTMRQDRMDELIAGVRSRIAQIKVKGLTLRELNKTKRQVLSGFVFGNQTVSSMAYRAALEEALVADADFSRRYVDEVAKVSNEDIKRVAGRYLDDDRLSVTILRPKADLVVSPNDQGAVTAGRMEKTVLDNGLVLLLQPDMKAGLVSLRCFIKGGSRLDNDEGLGLAQLTGAVWAKASRKFPKDRLVSFIEERGGSIGSGASNSSMVLTMDILSDDLDLGIDMVEDIIKNPSFERDAVERQRKDMMTSLETRKDDIMSFSSRALMESLFQDHPLRRDPLGSKESLLRISAEDVAAFYRQQMIPENMVISVVGAFDASRLKKTLARRFSSLSKGKMDLPRFDEAPINKTRFTELYMEKEQALVMVGFHAPSLADKDRLGIELISNYLGGGLGGRLFVKVRDELGQAYTASSRYSAEIDIGTFVLYVLTTPEKVDSVKAIISSEIERLKVKDLSTEELIDLKAYLKGSKVRSLQTGAARASTAAHDELNGLGFDFHRSFDGRIDALSAEDVRQAAKKYLNMEQAVVVITRPKRTEVKGHE